ncbi:aminotransferase class I/II-fold pyridoxal phosphate-dependent enzyme [Sphingomonas sp. 35-24ZXX]|uniref:aminotransferase class I/II-fold pyridoxal phosphate-dependent enzyme n=1 Tax=Sphingomonas sp. 35-24ZXX TaxID=1545915 RepID=UPI00053BDD23|nr:aminotransferase class I/II-fold pyridoxal phosphate-dependent enzyme [Sphingomonas sp. 35-24ZXX]
MVQAARALIDDFARHGGRIDMARAAFPHIARWTDLSTGIAPWAYPGVATTGASERLPDPAELAALEAAAASFFGADPARVVAVPGSDLAMRLLGLLLGRRSFVFRPAIVRPGYSGHASMWGGHDAAECAIDDIGIMAPKHDVLVLARPNNPDGLVADPLLLEWAALTMAARGGHLIVDEAFADADEAASLAGCNWPGLIVLRSFGKFFGLAGLRLGFVIAPPAIGADLRALIGDWPISGPALATGLAAYRDAAWHVAQRARLATASQRLADLLTRHRIAIVGRTAFFALASAERRDRLFVHLAQAGVLTRPFDYEPRWLRIGLPRDESDWARLDEALTTWRKT